MLSCPAYGRGENKQAEGSGMLEWIHCVKPEDLMQDNILHGGARGYTIHCRHQECAGGGPPAAGRGSVDSGLSRVGGPHHWGRGHTLVKKHSKGPHELQAMATARSLWTPVSTG